MAPTAWPLFKRSSVAAFERSVTNEAGFDELRVPHMAVLQFPGPDGVRPSTLAERAGMSKQAMNQLLLSLEAAGYLW
jgi:DNA-binding MarR family transcriptional regulator